jgi:metal-responsive CopG/Arc/MetJ family transcriptional regulator
MARKLIDTKNNKPLVKMGIALPDEHFKAVDEIAKARGVKRNAIFREAIQMFIKDRKKKELHDNCIKR